MIAQTAHDIESNKLLTVKYENVLTVVRHVIHDLVRNEESSLMTGRNKSTIR